MKIYTKTGDDGKTGILGSSRLDKFDVRIEAYGVVDELNAHMGVIRAATVNDETLSQQLLLIQEELFVLGSWLAVEPGFEEKLSMPSLSPAEVLRLESWVDEAESSTPPLKHFILPGGDNTVAQMHVARCVARRAERAILRLHDLHPVQESIRLYMNRLSDYLFVLARAWAHQHAIPETPWIPK